jgi:D-3-phosphoglycerate dehydrogenase / 2-oxoglutarate reductase
MRILIADRLPEEHHARLRAEGHELTEAPDLRGDDLDAAVGEHEVLVVRSTRVTAATLLAADCLRLVIRAGSGTDTIDLDAATDRGIAVCNVPGRNAIAVAELAVGLVLAIDRRIPEQVTDLREGRWRKGAYQTATGIFGRAVGVVGLGDIGLEFAARMVAFGTRVHGVADPDRATERQRRAEDLGITFVADLPTLAATCDILSFHVPLSDRTRGIIGEPLVSQVPEGAILINTARGDLVDPDALLAALDTRSLRVGLDVHPDEPAGASSAIETRLSRHRRVYGTHHVGASTLQAQTAVADGVVDIVRAFAGGEIRNRVNGAEPARAAR